MSRLAKRGIEGFRDRLETPIPAVDSIPCAGDLSLCLVLAVLTGRLAAAM